jgi:SSS family solute:Na+ symporter
LLAYFQAFPHFLPDSQALLADSDKLFAQYIVIGLPPGLSGLVVAGLLACAMSSLAAGINSTCSVVTIDFIDRIRHQNAKNEAGHISQLRSISVFVGIAVVLLSLLVNMVQGNLLEIAYKVVNLLTVPLGGLFFIAMFVPWARAFGAIVGLVCGLATVVLISFETEFFGTKTIGFIYAMPIALVVECGVGALASLIPIGKVKPMREII